MLDTAFLSQPILIHTTSTIHAYSFNSSRFLSPLKTNTTTTTMTTFPIHHHNPASRRRSTLPFPTTTTTTTTIISATASSSSTTTPAPKTINDTTQLGPFTVSTIGVGAWAWGDRLFWGYNGAKDDDNLRQAFNTSVDLGVNFFDTAEVYGPGKSEQLCGQFAREYTPPAQTDVTPNIYVATKFAPLPFRFGRNSVLCALKNSLKRLGTNKCDLYQIHWPAFIGEEALWDGLADCVEQGLAQAVGVSNYSASRLRKCHQHLSKRGVTLVSNQVQYSLLHRTPELNGVKNVCDELGIKILAYSPLAQGVLTGKFSTSEGLAKLQGPRKLILKQANQEAAPLLTLMNQLTQKYDKSMAQIALNWCICKDTIPIPGAKNSKQAAENAAAMGWRLDKEDVAKLDEVSLSVRGGRLTMGMPLQDADVLVPEL